MSTNASSASSSRRTRLAVFAVLALAAAGGIGYMLAPRIATKPAQPFIDAIDRDFPAPPDVAKLEERVFRIGSDEAHMAAGRMLHDFILEKAVLFEVGQMDDEELRACLHHYTNYLSEAFGRSGIALGKTTSGGAGSRLRIIRDGKEPRIVQGWADTWGECYGLWSRDGSSIEVSGELYDFVYDPEETKVLPVHETGYPVRGRRLFVVHIVVHGRGFTDYGHWSFDKEPDHR